MSAVDLIVGIEKSVTKLEKLAQNKAFSKLAFNHHVASVYYKETAAHKQAKEALLIKDDDTLLMQINKKLDFFFCLQKFEQTMEEHLLINPKFAKDSDPNAINIEVKLNPSLKYKKNKQGHVTPVGTRQISIPHIDMAKLGNFRDFKFRHGNVKVVYIFADKKQINVRAYTKEDGLKAVNHLLKLVEDKWIVGTAENHCYIGMASESTAHGDLHGLYSKATALHVGNTHGKMWTVFI
jgi:hypothetical protein